MNISVVPEKELAERSEILIFELSVLTCRYSFLFFN
jgi:hypothetical protein